MSRGRLQLSAIVLAIFATYTAVAVVIAIASGGSHGNVFWPTVILLLALAAWAGRRAIRAWHKAAAMRRDSN